MIPIRDENPTRRVPWFTLLLLAGNVAAYVWEVRLAGNLFVPLAAPHLRAVVDTLGVVPRELAALSGGPQGWPIVGPLFAPLVPLVTSTFLHGDLMHLLGNMLYLWIFGNNVEDAMGHGRFLVFYFVCGGVAALSQVVADPASPIPMVGASGAIAGVLGAYMIRFPHARVLVLVWLLFFMRVVRIPAFIVLGVWFFFQLSAAGGGGAGVAWYAHIGGFVAGLLLLRVFEGGAKQRRAA